jgi:hypothetical protein
MKNKGQKNLTSVLKNGLTLTHLPCKAFLPASPLMRTILPFVEGPFTAKPHKTVFLRENTLF